MEKGQAELALFSITSDIIFIVFALKDNSYEPISMQAFFTGIVKTKLKRFTNNETYFLSFC